MSWTVEDILEEREIRAKAWDELLDAVQIIDDARFQTIDNSLEYTKVASESIGSFIQVAAISTALVLEVIKSYKNS